MKELLRQIPKVDELLRHPTLAEEIRQYGDRAVTEAVRRELDGVRQGILHQQITAMPEFSALCQQISRSVKLSSLPSFRRVGETFAPGEVLVSLMRQYTPMPGMPAPLDRPITEEEYDSVLSWMFLNDLEGFTQEETAADTAFIPDF